MKSSNSRNKKTSANASTQSPETARPGHGGKAQPSLLEKFFTDQLMDMYWAEQQLLKEIPEMIKACTTEELEDALENHRKQTERHVERLQKVFNCIRKDPQTKKCEAMEGLIKEAREIIGTTERGSMTRDAALVIAAQKIEHYEIATYGGLVQLARTMNLNQAADLLDRTLRDEEEADNLLTDIAEDYINMEAEKEGFSWNKEEKAEDRGTEEEEELEEMVI